MTGIDDIEDIGKGENLSDEQKELRKAVIHKYKTDPVSAVIDETIEQSNLKSFVPGTQKVYIKTWGCTHNNSDSEYMAGLLDENGYQLVDDSSAADLWLLNSCTVKSPSEDHFRNTINEGLKLGKNVVLAGCVAQSAPKSSYLAKLSIIGVQQIDRVVEVVEESLKGNTVRLLGVRKQGKRKAGGSSLHLPKIRRNPLIEIIPINTGCLNQCTYCKTKHARGQLGSYEIEDIVLRAQEAFKEGVKEIWLTSEDTGAYGRDIGTNLPELLYALIKVIPDDCMLRIGMTNPPYILEHLDAMADILSNPKIYSFLHIPVQAGSDTVLGDMKREYCNQDFCQIVDFLREKVPGITIATDIICGFPTETEEDFEETIKLVKKYEFPVLYINQFYPRPGTPAAKMKRLPTQEVKRRSKKLTEVFESYFPYKDTEGREERILVTEESHDKKHYVGHNKFYQQILVPKNEEYLGKMIDIVITSCGKHYMIGKPLPKQNSLIMSLKTSLSKMQNVNYKTVWLTTCCVVLCTSIAFKLLKR